MSTSPANRLGELHHLQGGKLSFSYHEAWMAGWVAIPLSLSMPTITRTYEGKVVEAFLWGLLPDDEQTLARWRRGPRSPPEIRSRG